MSLPSCPKCNSEYTYEDGAMYVCPECAHEWNDAEPAAESDELIVKDANGNLLAGRRCRDSNQRPESQRQLIHAENRHKSQRDPFSRR